MSSLKVTDGKVSVALSLVAEYTNEDTEPITGTAWVTVPADHPLITGCLNIWHAEDGVMWHDDPMDNPVVASFVDQLQEVLAATFGATSETRSHEPSQP